MAVKEWLSLFTGMFLAGIVVIFAILLTRVLAYMRLHHPVANRRFKRRFRSSGPHTSAGAGRCPMSAPADPIRERRAG